MHGGIFHEYIHLKGKFHNKREDLLFLTTNSHILFYKKLLIVV